MAAKPLVYLAGPIKGLSYAGATDWRTHAAGLLHIGGIVALSPMRHKAYLRPEQDIADAYPLSPLSSQRGITTRDRFDVLRCDVVLANLLGAEAVSIGTMIELGWADAARKPVVLVMEPEGNPHDHAMVRELAGFRVPTLNDGLEIVTALVR